MARGSSVLKFEIDVSDVDRGVYESLVFDVAQHPSESEQYVVARVLAFCLEQTEGLAFSRGLAEPEDPALWIKDLTGRLLHHIEVGTPSAPRLHKASKAADAVTIYCHKDPRPWLQSLAGQKVHNANDIRLIALPSKGVDALAHALDRRNHWSLSRIDGVVFVEAGGQSHQLEPQTLSWP